QITGSETSPADFAVTVPTLRKVGVRVSASIGDPPVFWLLVAGTPGGRTPVARGSQRDTWPIPTTISDRINRGALARLFQAGSSTQNAFAIRERMPFDVGPPIELPKTDDSGYVLMLPEGDYEVAVILE